MRPKVGLNPTMLQKAAGRMTEPVVCVPTASGQKPAATAAADPLLDPPGVWSRLWGLRVGPGWKYANSAVTVLPRISAPAFRSVVIAGASEPSNNSGGKADPPRVSNPSTQKMSLTPVNTPNNGGREVGSG